MTPSKEVATVNPNSGVLALPADDPWSQVDDGWVGATAPEIAPILPLLGFNAKADGGFTDEATGQVYKAGDTIRVVWLAHSENRAWWELDYGKGDKHPSCRSSDMLTPDPSSPNLQAPTCAACPHSKWTDEPPACGVRVNVMAYLIDEQRITRTSFNGLALKHVARYTGTFKARLGGKPPMAFVTEITVGEEETGFGVFLVPEFRIAEPIDYAEAEPLIALRDEFLAQWRSMLAQDLAAATQAANGAGEDIGPFDDAGTRPPAGAVDTVSQAFPGSTLLDGEEPF